MGAENAISFGTPKLRRPPPKQYFISPLTRERAWTLTAGQGGSWNEEKGTGRGAVCFVCGVFDMAVTAKPKGVVMCCNSCGAGKEWQGDSRLLDAAVKAGFDCGPGPARRRGMRGGLGAAAESQLAGIKRAEKRVLAFCAKQTATRDWFEVSQRAIVKEGGGSKRDAIPLLNRLAER